MSEQEVFTKIQAIVADKLGSKQNQVTPEANFAEDLGADSLDQVELIMALEEAFNTDIPDEAAEKLATVQQVVDYISRMALS
jgi:acyl carrier protein